MGLDFQKFQGHVMVRFQVEIHLALVRAGLAVMITVWKPLLTLQHVHRCTSRVKCCYLHCNKPLYWPGGSASEKGTQCEKWVVTLTDKHMGMRGIKGFLRGICLA